MLVVVGGGERGWKGASWSLIGWLLVVVFRAINRMPDRFVGRAFERVLSKKGRLEVR